MRKMKHSPTVEKKIEKKLTNDFLPNRLISFISVCILSTCWTYLILFLLLKRRLIHKQVWVFCLIKLKTRTMDSTGPVRGSERSVAVLVEILLAMAAHNVWRFHRSYSYLVGVVRMGWASMAIRIMVERLM